ncbi:uncharacterized protein TNCV_2741341 [Trichonephila clavipes]|nr:uncharacterized protein TNCV_2741341 [Trichonephila clavipes]
MTPELAPPLLTTSPHQREDVSALDRFQVHRCPTLRVFSGPGLELVTSQPRSDTTRLPQSQLQRDRGKQEQGGWSLVYADKPQTLDHLEDNIRRVIADIRPQILEKVIENWTSRLDYIRASRGSPMPEIIFRISSPTPSFIPRPQNVSPSKQEEDERGPMPTFAIKDLLKKWETVRAMVLEWHPSQADVSRVGDLYNDNAINYFRKILNKREKQSTLDMFFNAP